MRTFPELRTRAPIGDAHLAQQLLDDHRRPAWRDARAAGRAARAVPFAIPATPGPAC